MEKHKYIVAMLSGIVLGALILFVIGKVTEVPKVPTDRKITMVDGIGWEAPTTLINPAQVFERGF